MKFKYKQGDYVKFIEPFKGEGVIVGVATVDLPVIGGGWIVKTSDGQLPNETYPFDTCVIFDCWIDLNENSNEK